MERALRPTDRLGGHIVSGHVDCVATRITSYNVCYTKLLRFCHAAPDLWYQMAAMLNGASALTWMSSVLGRQVADLEKEVEVNYSGPGSLIFLPYLTGERTPHNNPAARGVLFGLSTADNGRSMVQAVMEGVAYSLADGFECLAKTGSMINSLMLTGGGAKSRIWAQMIATIRNNFV